jgi:hypothetical protein
MSIQAEILARVDEGRLRPFLQMLPGPPPDARRIYFSEDMSRAFTGCWANSPYGRRVGIARALLEGFARGDLVVGRMPPSKNVHTLIAQLEPVVENVWEFRVGEPRPGIRILGRFAEQDTFIATNLVNREDFLDAATKRDNPRKWRDEVVRCKTIWTHLFPSYSPHTGNTIHDYISNARLPI